MGPTTFLSELWTIITLVKYRIQKLTEPIAQEEGLSVMQVLILFSLTENSISKVSELCREFGLNQGNVSTMCKNMERRGLIRRDRNADDERVITLSITKAGTDVVEKIKRKAEIISLKADAFPEEKLHSIVNGFRDFYQLLEYIEKDN